MSFALIAAMAVAWLIGGLIVATLWSRERSLPADLPLILPLGAILGVGVTSVLFFSASLISDQPARWAGGFELVVAAALIGCVKRRRSPALTRSVVAVAAGSWLQWVLVSLFLQAAVLAAIIAWRTSGSEPHGGWDGWAIWNMHARFMLRAGSAWSDLLAAPQLSWTHPDYPWLIPASVARAWSWIGAESPLAGAGISVVFAAATPALLVGAIARVRGPIPAFVAGLLLLGTPFFVTFASNQHADIPLGSFMLAAVVLVILGGNAPPWREAWALAGMCTGLAAWCKNEGMLFAVVFTAAVCLHAWRRGSRTAAGVFLGTLAVTLLPVLYFKFFLAPANDLMSAAFAPRMAHVSDLARHRLILASWWRDVRGFGEWQTMPFLAMAAPFAAWPWRRRGAEAERILPWVLLAMMAGFHGVYVLTPHDLAWHLDTSLVRLLLQLWPLALLWWGLSFPCGELGPAGASRRTTARAGFVFVNALGAAALFAALSGQPAANELALRRQGLNTVSATPGPGWFDVERHGRDTWAWSRGNATLQLHATAARSATTTTLRFALRSLAPRTVVIRSGERILWQGTVGENFVAVEIPSLVIPPGSSALEFTTDIPGIAESGASSARSLAFAIYNMRFE